MNAHYDVAIVGLGPVGALAANLLGQRGIRTLVFDARHEIYPLPRALGFDHEAMRILQGCGLADALEPYIREYPPTEYRGVGGRLISRFDSVAEPYPLGWAPNYVFNQPAFEQVLRDSLRRFDSVTVALGQELVSVKQPADVVALQLRSDDGEVTDVTARYALGADGGASTVRRQLGVGMESLDFDESWLVVDVRCSEEVAAQLPSSVIQYCDPARPVTYVVGPGDHRRWEVMLLPDEHPEMFESEEAVWKLLSAWVERSGAEIWRHATYQFHSVVAETWKIGNIMLMGDAAHMTPPFMAQGMVQGLRDAMNLSWKLDLVLQGGATAELLDSYEQERKPHVWATSEAAKTLGRVICELDWQKATARDQRMLREYGDPPTVRTRQELIPGLQDGVISSGALGAGDIFPQPFVLGDAGAEVRLDDLTGSCFRLIVTAQLAASGKSSEAEQRLRALGGSVVVVRAPDDPPVAAVGDEDEPLWVSDVGGLVDRWFVERGCTAALVRPDHYVFGGARDMVEVTSLLDQLDGWLLPMSVAGGRPEPRPSFLSSVPSAGGPEPDAAL